MLKTFMLEQTDIVNIYLRRYARSDNDRCVRGPYSYHNSQTLIATEKPQWEQREYSPGRTYTVLVNTGENFEEQYPHSHPKWPTECDWCDYQFKETDEWQFFTQLMYKRSDNGELVAINNAPPGAMYFAWWLKEDYRYSPTGPLYAVCPNGHPWNIDGRASNCTMPNDDVHRCWIRHGEPPDITVDKNGVTCQAGAGSIQAGDYHGFLQNGHFT